MNGAIPPTKNVIVLDVAEKELGILRETDICWLGVWNNKGVNMKKVVLSVVLGVFVVLGVASLMHASALSGYQDGCRDVIKQGAQENDVQIPDQAIDNYCHQLVQKYVGK